MKCGAAYYCDECGSEIMIGDACDECDPENGAQQVSFWFTGVRTHDDDLTSDDEQPAKRRWHFWWR